MKQASGVQGACAKGWNSTAKYEAGKKERAELNKRLIANAIKRGDQVVPR